MMIEIWIIFYALRVINVICYDNKRPYNLITFFTNFFFAKTERGDGMFNTLDVLKKYGFVDNDRYENTNNRVFY